jgi:hypothetical protein
MAVGITVGFLRPVLRDDEANIRVHELRQEPAPQHAAAAATAAEKIAAENAQPPPGNPVALTRDELAAARAATERLDAAGDLYDAVPNLRELHTRARTELGRPQVD